MTFTTIRSASAHRFDSPYSPAIRCRDPLAISGPVTVDATGRTRERIAAVVWA